MSDERSRFRRELKSWSKNELVREVERLRAINREHATSPGDDSTSVQGDVVDVAGDPRARGGVIIDAHNAILMDSIDVCVVDVDVDVPIPAPETTRLAVVLAGRVNMRDERSSVLFMFDLDGAAAICSQLFGVAVRASVAHIELLNQLVRDRVEAMPTTQWNEDAS